MDEIDGKTQLLKDEYLHIQKTIVDIDGRAVTIKAWSITFSGAGIGGAFVSDTPIILLLSSISSLIFWYLEAQWKHFQYQFYDRSGEIESYFRGENQKLAPMQIDSHWKANYGKYSSFKSLLKTMWKRHVMLPHLFIVGVGFVLYIAVLFCLIKI